MSNEKHTPGAWVHGVRDDGSIWLSIGDVDGPGPHYQGDLCASPADARLIASAPKLLEALRYARRMVKPSECDTAFIDAAIAQATGSTT